MRWKGSTARVALTLFQQEKWGGGFNVMCAAKFNNSGELTIEKYGI